MQAFSNIPGTVHNLCTFASLKSIKLKGMIFEDRLRELNIFTVQQRRINYMFSKRGQTQELFQSSLQLSCDSRTSVFFVNRFDWFFSIQLLKQNQLPCFLLIKVTSKGF